MIKKYKEIIIQDETLVEKTKTIMQIKFTIFPLKNRVIKKRSKKIITTSSLLYCSKDIYLFYLISNPILQELPLEIEKILLNVKNVVCLSIRNKSNLDVDVDVKFNLGTLCVVRSTG